MRAVAGSRPPRAGTDNYNEANAAYTVTVQATGTLALNVHAIAGDNTVNIAEKAAGFGIGGDTGTETGVGVSVKIGSTNLTATSSNADPATWSVSVPAGASYISGTSVAVEVSASKTGFTSPSAVQRTLAVDLTAPTAPDYSAPGALKVGTPITAMSPSSGSRHRQVQCHRLAVGVEHRFHDRCDQRDAGQGQRQPGLGDGDGERYPPQIRQR